MLNMCYTEGYVCIWLCLRLHFDLVHSKSKQMGLLWFHFRSKFRRHLNRFIKKKTCCPAVLGHTDKTLHTVEVDWFYIWV